MAIPDFQSLMMPLLKMASDGGEHSLVEAREALAVEFKLAQLDREERLPSGRQSKFANRVAWAKVYLQQAGLLLSPRRAHFQVSARGREVLISPPPRIDSKSLEQFPEFVQSRSRAGTEQQPGEPTSRQPGSETPEEALEAAHLKMHAGLASEVLARVFEEG